MTRNNHVPRFVTLVLVVSIIAFVAGSFFYPYLSGIGSGPVLEAEDFIIYPGFRHASHIPEHGPETMGAKIWFATGEMIQLPEDAYLSEKYDTWVCSEGVEMCPTVPAYIIVRGYSDIAIDGEGRIFAKGSQLHSEYLRRFAFLKERLPPDRTPEYLEDLHPAYADEPCTMLKCEWW